jgi:zinc transporter ZupT
MHSGRASDFAAGHVRRHLVQATEALADKDCSHLVRTSILVWLALAMHNIPEGLATFVGYV